MNKIATVSILVLVVLLGLIYAYVKFDFEILRSLFSGNQTRQQDRINSFNKESILNELSNDSQANRENTVKERLKYLDTIQFEDGNLQQDKAINLEEKKAQLDSL